MSRILLRSLLLSQAFFLFGNVFAQGTSNQIVAFRKIGQKVEFSPPQGSISFSLQSQSRAGTPWNVLSTIPANTTNAVISLAIPSRARNQNLRVVATVRLLAGQRRSMPFTLAPNLKSLTFRATNQVRLYSVESYQSTNKSWSRVSTVAASLPAGRVVKVNLPSSLGKISAKALRVLAVSENANASADLASPVASNLRSGLSKFPARQLSPASSPFLADGLRATSTGLTSSEAETTSVEEADLWKIRGRKIYLFNQNRGLQVLDVAIATNPVISGFWPLPAVGEDLYLLGAADQPASGALLLARLPWRSERAEGTRILRLSFSNDVPSLETFMDLPGGLQESRLVGDRLHLISTSWQDKEGNSSPTTWITTLNVSQPKVLVEESRETIPRYVSAVGNTGKYLWCAGSDTGNWFNQTLTAFPIQPGGTLGKPLVVQLGGNIQDKFKVGDVEGGLAAVVQTWTAPDGSWRNRILLETYRPVLDSGGVPSGFMDRLAQLEIIQDEWLYATRFDGDRLYAVTFQNTDPLWLISLSDPANPTITSHLEVPGWSSFIEPLGDLLVAVGRENGRVQVSLFDVSDRSNPTLASRVNLGDSDYSWSEAEWNEKAVKILPKEGLILVPVTEWAGGNVSHGVRIVSFNGTGKTLITEGTIRHSFSPRRSTLLEGDLVASVSNRELLLIDTADRQSPSIKAEVTLAFAVDRLAVRSGFLYQFENANSWQQEAMQALLRVAPVDDPDDVVAQIPLVGTAVLAAEILGDRLVVVEGTEESPWGICRAGTVAASASSAGIFVSVWNLQSPALPSFMGRISLPGSAGGRVAILPGSEGLAVVTRKAASLGRWGGGDVRLMSSDRRIAYCGVGQAWYGLGNESLVIDLINLQGSPAVVGSWSLQDNQVDEITSVQAFGDLLVFGYQRRQLAVLPESPAVPGGPLAIQPDFSRIRTSWECRSWLQVIDLADPSQPTGWAPVEIPGALLGFSWLERGGGILFSRNGPGDNRVNALGFDGENAAVAAELDVGPNSAILANGTSVYASVETGIKKWVFSESTGSFSDPVSWMTTSWGGRQLAFAGDVPVALLDNTLYGLIEGEAINLGEPPDWVDLKLARSNNGQVLIPAGAYGTFRAKPAP